jgi:ATP-binding cassette, subfamily C, bacterial
MDEGQPLTLRDLLRNVPRGKLIALIALMIAGALTDGIGIMMLAPLLSAIDSDAAAGIGGSVVDMLGISMGVPLLLAIFVALVAARAIILFVLGQTRLRLQHQLVDRLRRRCYAALLGAEWRWLTGQRAADHNAVLTTNIASIGIGFDQMIGLFANMMMIIAYVLAALFLSWQATLLAVALGLGTLLALARFRKRARYFGGVLNTANRDLHRHVQQGLSSIRLAKIFGQEPALDAGFASAVDAVRQTKLVYSRDTATGQALIQIGAAILLAILAYSAIIIWKMPLAVLLPLLLVFTRLAPMVASIQQGWNHALHALPALNEVHSLIDEALHHAEPKSLDNQLDLQQSICLSDVSFGYGTRDASALNGVSITIPANTTTAIVGESGSGKSTFADLVMGLLEPDSGSILIDGVLLNGANRIRWRERVAYVEQSPILLHDSIRANLLWGKSGASDADMIAALQQASADFVFSLPDGLDTIVGDGGMRLSGGERQRITLARALLRSPALLILDEATSALDQDNIIAVRRAIDALHGRMTVIQIGHQMSLRDGVDQVIEFDKGTVTTRSTHARNAAL